MGASKIEPINQIKLPGKYAKQPNSKSSRDKKLASIVAMNILMRKNAQPKAKNAGYATSLTTSV
jgi:hypothetical protein